MISIRQLSNRLSTFRALSGFPEKKLCLAGLVTALFFSVACSSSHTVQIVTRPTPTPGGFSTASLKGNYTYRLSGTSFGLASGNGVYERAGTFVADGNGNITSGMDDFVQGSTPSSNQLSGNYAISGDGTGLMTLNLESSQLQLALTMVTGSTVYLMEFDLTGVGTGTAVAQDSTAFNLPSGTFAFRFHSFQPNLPSPFSVSRVGTMEVSNGAVTGNEDIVRTNALSSLTLTGSLSAPDSTGRGSATFLDSAGFTLNYLYYVIDSNTLNLLETDQGPLGGGRAEMRTGAPFSTSSLNNVFVFQGQGDTETLLAGLNNIGAFNSDGNGNVTFGSYDATQNGEATIINASLSGNYSLNPSGRAVINLNPQGSSSLQLITWLVSPTRAFFLVDSADGMVEDGTMDQQQTISTGALNGQYSVYMSGVTTLPSPLVARTGVVTFNGSSVITLTDYFINQTGLRNQTNAPAGTYSLGANGRVSASIPGITSAMVLYLTSNGSGGLILEDPGAEISGSVQLQVAP